MFVDFIHLAQNKKNKDSNDPLRSIQWEEHFD